MAELPKAPVRRLLKKAGASRVSSNAVEAMRKSLESAAKDMTKSAVKAAKNDGRKTVQKRDITKVK